MLLRVHAVQLGNAPVAVPVELVLNTDALAFAHPAEPVNGEDTVLYHFVGGHTITVLGDLDVLAEHVEHKTLDHKAAKEKKHARRAKVEAAGG